MRSAQAMLGERQMNVCISLEVIVAADGTAHDAPSPALPCSTGGAFLWL